MENVFVRATPIRWIQRGWEIVKPHVEIFIVLALIYIAASMAAGTLAPVIGHVLVAGGLIPGFFLACLRAAAGTKPTLSDLFDGFKYWVAGTLAVGLTELFVFIGTLALVIPGILIFALYLFAPLYIVDKKMDFWPAMEASRKLVMNDLLGFFLLALAIIGINIIGLIPLGLGLLITVPVSFMAITVAYQELVGAGEYPPPPPPAGPVNIP